MPLLGQVAHLVPKIRFPTERRFSTQGGPMDPRGDSHQPFVHLAPMDRNDFLGSHLIMAFHITVCLRTFKVEEMQEIC